MYGTPQASIKFFEFMCSILVNEMEFTQSTADRCLFVKRNASGKRIMLAIHVDDILGITENVDDLREIQRMLINRLKVTWHEDDKMDYVGITILRDRPNKSIKVSMQGLIDKAVTKFGHPDLKPQKYPSKFNDDVFDVSPDSPPVDRIKYLGLLMTLMYPARFVRPEYLLITSILATRSQNPVQEDWDRLIHLLGYLKRTSSMGIIFGLPTEESDKSGKHPWGLKEFRIHVDYSHGKHHDGKGHMCIIGSFGTGPVVVKCSKIKHVTLSSTESEISGCSEAGTFVIWFKLFMHEIGEDTKYPTIIYQDNSASITMNENGGGTFKRSKHMIIRKQFINELIADGSLILVWLSTAYMTADISTKCKWGKDFREFLKLLFIE
jgi:hypothetical protein